MQLALRIACTAAVHVALAVASLGQTVELAKLQPALLSTYFFPPSFGTAASLSAGRAFVGGLLLDRVIVYEPSATGAWIETAAIQATWSMHNFGAAVSAQGDRVVVGDPDWNTMLGVGAAFVFERAPSGIWDQKAAVVGTGAGQQAHFGTSVAIRGDLVLVGAPGAGPGKVYAFERSPGGAWVQTAELTASDAAPGDDFGSALALASDRAIVCAPGDDDLGSGSGSAYVFERHPGGAWSEFAKLHASDGAAGRAFGASAAISGERALIGAADTSLSALEPGAAYVFDRLPTGAWTETAKLQASDGDAGNDFGLLVALAGDRAAIGAMDAIVPPVFPDAGAVYVYERDAGGSWLETDKLERGDPHSGDQFGSAVALEGDRVLVGNSNEELGAAAGKGAARVFDLEPLSADVGSISVSLGGTQTFDVDAGHAHAGEIYHVLGSTSGTSPGFSFGGLLLPLNLDRYFRKTYTQPGTPPLFASYGVLSVAGSAIVAPSFHLAAGANPALIGLTYHHAFVTADPVTLAYTFVSNPLALKIVP